MSQRIVFVVAKQEPFVLLERESDGCAEPVLVVARVLLESLILQRLVDRVQMAVQQVIVDRPMQLVGAALDDRIELAAGRMTVFGRELVLQHGELRNSIVGDEHQRPCHALIVVVDAFDSEIVVARTLAADGRSRSGANTSAACDARAEQREV